MLERPEASSWPLVPVHRIHGLLIRLIGALQRLAELLLENPCAILLALDLFVEALRGLAFLRLQALHHRFERTSRPLRLLLLMKEDLAAEAVDDKQGIAAGTIDLEVLGHGE